MMRMQTRLPDPGFDITYPFDLPLRDPARGTVRCEAPVRVLPGRRLVCRANWDGREVFVKLFAASARAARDHTAEIAGIEALHAHAIAAPTLLYADEPGEAGGGVLIYAAITPAHGVADGWAEAGAEAHRTRLLALAEVIAGHHQAGLVHTDPHPDNFLVHDGTIYTLDGAAIEIRAGPLERRSALDNLALVLAQFTPQADVHLDAVLECYAQSRDMSLAAAERSRLARAVRRQRRYRERKYLHKIQRECSAIVCRQAGATRILHDRGRDSPALRELLEDPDHCIDAPQARILKAGNTCTVALCEAGGVPLVIKRYNIKSARHGIRRALRRTRASRSWENAHRLRFHGIDTAQAVAMLERRIGPLRGRAYFVMSYIEGPHSMEYFSDDRVSGADRELVAGRIAGLFARLASHRISHGDMKATNFIIRDQRPVLLDLDAMQVHRSASTFRRAFTRDVLRFLRNWSDSRELTLLFTRAFRDHGLDIPPDLRRPD